MEAFADIFRKGLKQLFDSDMPSKSYKLLAARKRNVQMAEEMRQKFPNRDIRPNRSNKSSVADRVVNMLCETALR